MNIYVSGPQLKQLYENYKQRYHDSPGIDTLIYKKWKKAYQQYLLSKVMMDSNDDYDSVYYKINNNSKEKIQNNYYRYVM